MNKLKNSLRKLKDLLILYSLKIRKLLIKLIAKDKTRNSLVKIMRVIEIEMEAETGKIEIIETRIDIIEVVIEMIKIEEEDLEVLEIEEAIKVRIIEDVDIHLIEMIVEIEGIKETMRGDSRRSIEEIEMSLKRREKEMIDITNLNIREDHHHLLKALRSQLITIR